MLLFPSDDDLKGAAVALMRLQDTYKLDTHALAEGNLLGKKYSRHLTGKKCVSNFRFLDLIIHHDLSSWRLLGTWPPILQQR